MTQVLIYGCLISDLRYKYLINDQLSLFTLLGDVKNICSGEHGGGNSDNGARRVRQARLDYRGSIPQLSTNYFRAGRQTGKVSSDDDAETCASKVSKFLREQTKSTAELFAGSSPASPTNLLRHRIMAITSGFGPPNQSSILCASSNFGSLSITVM